MRNIEIEASSHLKPRKLDYSHENIWKFDLFSFSPIDMQIYFLLEIVSFGKKPIIILTVEMLLYIADMLSPSASTPLSLSLFSFRNFLTHCYWHMHKATHGRMSESGEEKMSKYFRIKDESMRLNWNSALWLLELLRVFTFGEILSYAVFLHIFALFSLYPKIMWESNGCLPSNSTSLHSVLRISHTVHKNLIPIMFIKRWNSISAFFVRRRKKGCAFSMTFNEKKTSLLNSLHWFRNLLSILLFLLF